MLDFETIERRTFAILRDYPETRSNDKILHMWYYRIYHETSSLEEICNIHIAPHFKSIERARRDIQLEGHFPPDENAVRMRRLAEKEMKAYYKEKAKRRKKLADKWIKDVQKEIEKEWRKEWYGEETYESTRRADNRQTIGDDPIACIMLTKTRRNKGTMRRK